MMTLFLLTIMMVAVELVVVTPIWVARESSPICNFIWNHLQSDKKGLHKLAPFFFSAGLSYLLGHLFEATGLNMAASAIGSTVLMNIFAYSKFGLFAIAGFCQKTVGDIRSFFSTAA